MKTVVVTGATGFIAAHVIARLLATGHRVRGTVRSLAKPLDFLQNLPGASGPGGRLELVEADLLAPAETFLPIVRGADAVLHLASPYVLHVKDAQKDLVDPALRGTTSVLEACAHTPSVKRVVVTSSMAAVTDQPDSSRVLTESDWNERSSLSRNPYFYSKVVAERAAWEFMSSANRHFDLVVINPFLVIGPSLTPGTNTSNQMFADLFAGTYPGILDLTFSFVDVRDVADAHLRALAAPTASGRYLCAGETISMRDVVELLAKNAPADTKLPRRRLDGAFGTFLTKLGSYFQPRGLGSYLRTHVGRAVRYDTGKIQRELGITFRPVASSILDTVRDMRLRGEIPTTA